MSTLQSSPGDRETVQDETTLIWYAGKKQKQLHLRQVSRIIPGQRTAIFERYPQPEKEYQSFSLIYGKNSLDVICKDKHEAEIWFVALSALISRGNSQKWRTEIRSDITLSDCSSDQTERNSQSILSNSSGDGVHEDKQGHQIIDVPLERLPQKRLARAFSDVVLYKAAYLCSPLGDSVHYSGTSQPNENVDARKSADNYRLSFSSAISTSSLESSSEDISLSSIFMWGEGIEDGLLDEGMPRVGKSFPRKDAFLPKVLESASTLDTQHIACGSRHAVLVTRQGEVFSWGDGSGGKLGHGLEADFSTPKPIEGLSGLNIVSVGCGEYHCCAVTLAGELYTWGDGIHNSGLLGHGNELSYWTPRKVRGQMEGICITSISCGPWHSAAITSLGQLFTFGDGTFGALGHGDRCCRSVPREIEALKGQKVVRVSCGFWHTAAIIEVPSGSLSCGDSLMGKLFTWGNGDEGQLGHGDNLCRLVPCCVATPNDKNFCQVACGHSITVALTICGQVYTMGSTDCGGLKCPGDSHALPTRVIGEIKNCCIKEISCGAHHVVAVTSESEVFTWGKGRNGQLGHGGNADRNSPTLVKALKGKQVKRVICGNNCTAAICLHQWVSATDYSICAGCRSPFSFKRKRHNCYNCGLVFCKACTNKKSLNASLAPNLDKLYRVCEDCYTKLNSRPPKSSFECVPGKPSKEKKKDSCKAKQRGALSRLSSFDSFRRSNKQLSQKNQKLDSSSTHKSPYHGRNVGCDRSFPSSPSASIFDSFERANALLLSSKIQSPSPSVSTKSTPHSLLFPSSLCSVPYHEQVIDDSKQTNDDLIEEISFLREQVDILTHKSQFLSAELERTSNQLNEVTACVQDESQKNNAAKEAIKCLMTQLKDMAARVPEGASCRASGQFADNLCHVLSTAT
ncbi:putative protein, contains RCC1 domain [Handroanthus impetiginosus]|uniref:FYVE-type domain-containing protein n=1 Tax=Handroanthus impetiginosus TaxID=429701 RepID=A0A2G9G610_9LAMI|nr:putative protein, contains RCC1 domain [Handroanthus impetiginosus]